MVRRVSGVDHELLSSALAHLGGGVIITDNNLQRSGPLIIYVSPAVCRMSGYTSEEILNKSPQIFQGEETDRSKLSMLKAELEQGRSCTVELVAYRKNGERLDVDLFLSPIFNAQGECTNYISVVHDLSEKNRLAKELLTRERHLKAVLNTAVDAIVTIDQRGIIVSANQATVTMFGYALEELVGANVNILMPEPFHREHDRYIRNYLETGHAKVIGVGRELNARRKDGKLFPVDLAVTQVDDTGLFTGVIRDLTSRRELQQQILEIAGAQRRKIGHVLQEGIGQDLTALHLLASTLANCLSAIAAKPGSQNGQILLQESELDQVQRLTNRLVDATVESVKNLSELTLGVMPVQQDSHGLNVAIQQLCNDVTGASGLKCSFTCQTALRVENNSVATHVYHLIKEAIANLSTLSQVSCIHVRMFEESDELNFEVSQGAES